ncbi:hypothetical protein R1sor_001887 [Riccia sorocarpa]|uniref:Uncharacterized protein n=1 Tax=Riccia sorocarpa TaxID=122646 RepID=A0ABD3GX74_9MARC
MGGCTLLVRSAETTTTITTMEEVKDTPLPSVRSRPPDGEDEDETVLLREAASRVNYQGERKDVAGLVPEREGADEKNPEVEEKEFEKAAQMRVMPTDSVTATTSEPVQPCPRNVEGDEETFPDPVIVVETKSETDSGELRQDLQSEQERNNNLSLLTSSNNVTKLTIVVPLLSAEEPHVRSERAKEPPRQPQGERSSVETGATRTLSSSRSNSSASSWPTLVSEDAAAAQPSKQIELSGLTSAAAAAEKQLSSPFKRPAERSLTPCWTNPTEAHGSESRGYKRMGDLMTRNRPAAAAAAAGSNFSFQMVAPGPNSTPVPLEIAFRSADANLGDTAEVADGVSRSTREVSPEPGMVPMEEQLDRLQRQSVEMRMRSRTPRSSMAGPRVLPANATVLSSCDPDLSSWMQTCDRRNQELGRGSGVAQFRERYNFDVERGVPVRESEEERWEWQRQDQQQ